MKPNRRGNVEKVENKDIPNEAKIRKLKIDRKEKYRSKNQRHFHIEDDWKDAQDWSWRDQGA